MADNHKHVVWSTMVHANVWRMNIAISYRVRGVKLMMNMHGYRGKLDQAIKEKTWPKK